MIGRILQHRSTLFLAALCLFGAMLAQSARERDHEGPPLSSLEVGDSGARALAMWLEQLGHKVERASGPSFRFDSAEVLFILSPLRPFERNEAQSVVDWVRRRGVLVYLTNPTLSFAPSPTTAPEELDSLLNLRTSRRFDRTESPTPTLAFFAAPPARRFDVETRTALELDSDEWMPLVQAGERTFVATRTLGEGRVYAATSPAFFSNSGIVKEDNAALVLNILARHSRSGSVVFEEYHHTTLESPTLATVARQSPWGWAIAFAAITGFAFLVWGGRRFGPPLLSAALPNRSTGEYVTSMAGLLQRARAVEWAQRRYAGQVRRRLARSLGIRADLPARDMAQVLAARTTADHDQTAAHIHALDGPKMSERALITAMRELEPTLRLIDHGGA